MSLREFPSCHHTHAAWAPWQGQVAVHLDYLSSIGPQLRGRPENGQSQWEYTNGEVALQTLEPEHTGAEVTQLGIPNATAASLFASSLLVNSGPASPPFGAAVSTFSISHDGVPMRRRVFFFLHFLDFYGTLVGKIHYTWIVWGLVSLGGSLSAFAWEEEFGRHPLHPSRPWRPLLCWNARCNTEFRGSSKWLWGNSKGRFNPSKNANWQGV